MAKYKVLVAGTVIDDTEHSEGEVIEVDESVATPLVEEGKLEAADEGGEGDE